MSAKLRHLAITVPDLEAGAAFYESAFDLKRVKKAETPFGSAVSLTDGVVNLTLLNFPNDAAAGDERGSGFVGLHHFGFIVDDLEAVSEAVTANGGRFHKEIGGDEAADFERKFRDPNGIIFDLAPGWVGTGED